MKLEYGTYPNFYKPKKLIISENIEHPDLFVGREIELKGFWDILTKFPYGMPDNRAIIAQRKMGKTAFLRRFFNVVFVEQDEIVPLYFCFGNKPELVHDVAKKIAITYLGQWLAFTTRDDEFLSCNTIEDIKIKIPQKIKDKKIAKYLKGDIENCEKDIEYGDNYKVLSAPFLLIKNLANSSKRRPMVIVDEVQEMEAGKYHDKNRNPVKHAGAIFEIADKPNIWTLVSGSSVSMLHYKIITGAIGNRIGKFYFSPLEDEDAKKLVDKLIKREKYKVYKNIYEDIYNLVKTYPYYITRLLTKNMIYEKTCKEEKDFSSKEGLFKAFRFEALHAKGDIFSFWENHFIENAEKMNSNPTNRPGLTYNMLSYISKHHNLVMTFEHLAKEFQLKNREEAKKRAYQLVEADLAQRGKDIFFSIHGIPDPVLPIVLPQIQHRKDIGMQETDEIAAESIKMVYERLHKVEKDVDKIEKDVEKTNEKVRSIGGKVNRLSGGEFEDKVKEALEKDKTILNGYKILGEIERKFVGKRGKSEQDIDLFAMLENKKKNKKNKNTRIALAVEVKNQQKKVCIGSAKKFVQVVEKAKKQKKLDKTIAIFVNTGGFSANAQKELEKAEIQISDANEWGLR